jgi:hypothetical protein
MQPTTLEDLFLNPGFLAIFFAILTTIGNVMVGVSMLPEDQRRKRYQLHLYVFFFVLAGYLFFLAWNHFVNEKNSFFDYAVLFYFSVVIPLSRRASVTAHAIIASVGLVLMTVAAFLQVG